MSFGHTPPSQPLPCDNPHLAAFAKFGSGMPCLAARAHALSLHGGQCVEARTPFHACGLMRVAATVQLLQRWPIQCVSTHMHKLGAPRANL
jgi:hypothetical protein